MSVIPFLQDKDIEQFNRAYQIHNTFLHIDVLEMQDNKFRVLLCDL